MTFSQDVLSIIAVASAAIALLALVIALRLGSRLRQVRRAVAPRRRQPGAASAVSDDVAGELADVRDVLVHSIQRVGLVRFDAFEDMGGKLSFAVALLDGEGSGVVLSSINGRSETRIYAKPVERGKSRIALSEEEIESIRRALGVVRT